MDIDKEIELSDNALAVLNRRYLIKDKQGRVIETPRELFIRVARFVAQADAAYGADNEAVENTATKFYEFMSSLEFLPNSPTLMNAGRSLGQLSACFVLPVGDSMEEIFETNKHAALIHKSGGGTGFSFSRLRPRNAVVASTSGVASGPVSFMKVYNSSTEAVKQGGTRRGANMGILRVDHPDILEFIACKESTGEITNFNISVAITDSFMEALSSEADYPLVDPRTDQPYRVDGAEVRLRASEVFDEIVRQAWRTGEPGIIFIDRINRTNPTAPSEKIEATNPCGEQPLPPFDSCNLGSVNLGRCVIEPLPNDFSPIDAGTGVDWDRLGRIVRTGVHFLDNVIDQNRYPLKEIEAQSKKNRRVGLGVMGWADMLVRLRLPYDSEEAFTLAERVMAFIAGETRKQSSTLAKTRGRFPNWEGSVYAREGVAMRNATVTTIAPTGTIAIIAGCSSGIEPYYSLAFERNVMDGTRLLESNPLFEKLARKGRFFNPSVMRKLASERSIAKIDEIPQTVRALFVTAVDVAPEDHIRMQAVFQKHVDSSVSKTINMAEAATVDDVKAAYLLAWETGCKGVTVYRDNSRPEQVLAMPESTVVNEAGSGSISVQCRPPVLTGLTEKIRTGYGNLYVTINSKNGRPFELFAQIGKSGYSTMADTEAISRLISLALRGGVEVDRVVRQLRGIGGANQIFADGARIFSIPDAIAQVLNRHFGSGDDATDGHHSAEMCPDCSAALKFESGCYVCPSCGYSNC